MAAAIVRRIFANRPLPPQDAPEEEFKKQFDAAVLEFEESGFLEQVKLPAINDELELVTRLHEHRNDLVVIKYWKRGCLPCMGLAEMYKAAEQQLKGRRVHFYSVNTKAQSCLGTVAHQLIEGTPTIQVFHGGRQVGDEIQAQQLSSFLSQIEDMKAQCGIPEQ